jgi:hypothetical protein
MGPRARQLLATLYVALSLALFAQVGTDPTGGFCLRTLSYSGPTTIMGPILHMVPVSRSAFYEGPLLRCLGSDTTGL